MVNLPLLDNRDIEIFEKYCSKSIPHPIINFPIIDLILNLHINSRRRIERFFKKNYDEKVVGIMPGSITQTGGDNRCLVFSEKHIIGLKFYDYSAHNLNIIENGNIDILPGFLKLEQKYSQLKLSSKQPPFEFEFMSDNKLYSPAKLESLLLHSISEFLSQTEFFPKKVNFELRRDEKEVAKKVLTFPNSGYTGQANSFSINPLNYERTNKSLADRIFNHFKVPASGGSLKISNSKFFISPQDKDVYIENMYNINDSVIVRSKIGSK